MKKRMLLKKKIEEERTKKSEEGNKSSKEEISQPSGEHQKKVASESKVNESPQIPQQAEKKSLAEDLQKIQERLEKSRQAMIAALSQMSPDELQDFAQTMSNAFESTTLFNRERISKVYAPSYLSELFLIYRDGKLAESLGTFKDENEARLSMLYTVQNIIKELNRTTQTQDANISFLQFDDKTIAIEGETNTYLVAVIDGNEEPKELRKDMQRCLMRLQREYPKYLSREYTYGKDFNGAKRILAEVWNKYCNPTKKTVLEPLRI
ncbi:MAG: hypothetical protein QXT63_08675 [Thermoplasmata archaeon]